MVGPVEVLEPSSPLFLPMAAELGAVTLQIEPGPASANFKPPSGQWETSIVLWTNFTAWLASLRLSSSGEAQQIVPTTIPLHSTEIRSVQDPQHVMYTCYRQQPPKLQKAPTTPICRHIARCTSV